VVVAVGTVEAIVVGDSSPDPIHADRRCDQHHDDRRARILEALELLHPDRTVHVRTPRRNGTGVGAGFFTPDRRQALLDAVLPLIGKTDVWVNLNSFNPSDVKYFNSFHRPAGAGSCLSDKQILRRHWILIDVDPERPTDTASTDEQHEAALQRAHAIRDFLLAAGFPRDSLALADSGNGAHVLVKICLPNNAESLQLVERFLTALHLEFSDDAIRIDLTTHNASRVMKLPGTIATKGPNTPDRPHREAILLEAPASPVDAPTELLESIAGRGVEQSKRAASGTGDWPDAEEWCAAHGIGIRYSAAYDDGRKHILTACPFNHDHDNAAALLIQWKSRVITFRCLHNSCTGRNWNALRDLKEPGWRKRYHDQRDQGRDDDDGALPLECLADVTARRVEFLAYPHLPKGKITIVFGDAGDGKTMVVLAIVAAYTQGLPLLPGSDPVAAGNVLLLDAENDPEDTLKPRLLALGGNPDRVIRWNTRKQPLPTIATGFDLIEQAVRQSHAGLLVMDPMQAVIGAEVKTGSANQLRPVLSRLSVICERTGCTAIPIMHANKRTEGRALHRLLDSVDFGATARSVLLVARHKENKDQRVLAHCKSNVGPEADSIGFLIHAGQDRGDAPTLEWTGTEDVTADELMQTDKFQRDDSKIERCVKWLRELLTGGSRLRQDIIANGQALGFYSKLIDRAGARLHVRSTNPEGRNAVWSLP
jgi:hypothetical protein